MARASGLHLDAKSQSMLQESLGETSKQSVVVAVDKLVQFCSHLVASEII